MDNKILKTCGFCEHWMKSSDCPREKRNDFVNTSKIGLPNCNSLPCEKFQLSTFYIQKNNKQND